MTTSGRSALQGLSMPGDPGVSMNGRALMGFCVSDPESAGIVTTAAEAEGFPIALCISPDRVASEAIDGLSRACFELANRSAVPVEVVLARARSLDMVDTALHLGFTSITVDGSFLPFERNIALTAEAVRMVTGADGYVEGEIGAFGDFGRDGGGNCLYFELAERFVRETGIPGLSVALSPDQSGDSAFDHNRLAELHRRLDCAISLHDASLLSPEDILRAVGSGAARLAFSSCLLAGNAPGGNQTRSGTMLERTVRQRLRLLRTGGPTEAQREP